MTTNQQPTHEAVTVPDDQTILEIRNASVTFDMDRGESKVMDNVSVDIKRDEILGVVGESGSGKSMFASSLLDAIVEPGILTGEITYYPSVGDSVNLLELSEQETKAIRWEEISMVFQGAMSSFNPTMTIGGHFEETLRAHQADVEDGLERAHELLSDLYLEPERVMSSFPHELSGGMQQRALIALSLVLEPEVLVMDEPTAALDLLMQQSILALLRDIQQKYNLTVVFITHDLPLVAGLADRLAVMYAFRLVEIGPADDLVRDAAHPYTRALLKSVPNTEADVDEMRPIEGASPDPVNVPHGCSYHPRCPLATELCRQEDPGYYETGEAHFARCHHWEQAADAIEYSVGSATSSGDLP